MGDVVNLNRFRKRCARDAQAAEADANRAKFGRTRREKTAEKDEAERRDAVLDGAKRETPDD